MTKHEKRILNSFARSLCLCDHMGDVADALQIAFGLLRLKFCADDEGIPSVDGFEGEGGVCLYVLKKELKCTRKT